MTINHHLSDVTLGAYTSGSLSEAMSLVAASHISSCPICFERQNRMEELGGAYLQSSVASTMSDAALQNTMNKLDEKDFELLSDAHNKDNIDHTSTNDVLTQNNISIIPRPLQNYLPENLDDITWKSLAPGIKHFAISDLHTDGGSLFMLNIAPGIRIPEHGHKGIELTQVLKGSFSDDVGYFTVGDIVDLDDDVEHQPVVGSDESCICLIASEAPLRFTGLVPRLVHFFSGM
jgi:putative transcriptional regulator